MNETQVSEQLDTEQVTTSTASPSPQKKETFFDLIKFALLALLIVIPIRTFIAQPFVVSGDSMLPTFENKQYLIVDELTYNLGDPKRGEVVIFKFPTDQNRYLIKRVIGLPNETVRVDATSVTIINEAHPEGLVLDEPYVQYPSAQQTQLKLGPDEYFVMGDNRSASYDSRFWGPLKRDFIVGRPFVRLLPVTDINMFPGKHIYNN